MMKELFRLGGALNLSDKDSRAFRVKATQGK